MRMRKALIAAALAGCAGCAQFSQSDANNAAVAVANAAGAALGNAGVSSARPENGGENGAAMTFGSNSYRANCGGGGREEISYTISNSIVPQTGSGYIGIQMLVTFTDCSSGGVLINGNPNIDVTGHFSFLSGNPSGTWFLRMS